jgi:O-antigen/teichoic acid export membrane protein
MNPDTLQSVRNAVKLGLSLVLTWAVALGVRLLLPRHLGPELFGAFQFADAITATLFVLTGLGLETYIRKEAISQHDTVSGYLGGVFAARLAVSAVVVLVLMAILVQSGKPQLVRQLVLVLALGQALVIANTTYSALLHAVGVVNGLSILNVVSKVLWGVGILAVFAMHRGVVYVAWALVLSEAVKLVALYAITRRHLGLRMSLNLQRAGAVLALSFPFFLSDIARTAMGKIDVAVLSFLTSDLEVGWYAAASNLAGLSMLITPLIGWVLLPLTSRAQARSDQELTALTRRAMELILVIAIPFTFFMCLGAKVIVGTIFGAEFAPAARSLTILAPMFVLTYVAIVSAITLIRLDREWTLTGILMTGVLVTPLLSWLVVPWAAAAFGPGGAGIGTAISLVTVETVMTATLAAMVWKRAFDRRTLAMVGKTFGVCAVVVAVHWLMQVVDVPLSGILQLGVEFLLYGGMILAVRAVDIREVRQFVRRAAAPRGESYAVPM